MQYANGGWYPADINYHPGLGEVVVAGEGYKFNLKRKHDCRRHAARRAEQIEQDLAKLTDYSANITEYESLLSRNDCPATIKPFMESQLSLMRKAQADYPANKASLESQLKRYSALAKMT